MPTEKTIKDFKRFCVKLVNQKKRAMKAKDASTKENKALIELQAQAVEWLKALGTKNHAYGKALVYLKDCTNVPMLDKGVLYKYLKKRKDFDDIMMAMINAKDAADFYFAEEKLAIEKKKGLTFKIPGMGKSKTHQTAIIKGVKADG